jgi:hypothetical protein
VVVVVVVVVAAQSDRTRVCCQLPRWGGAFFSLFSARLSLVVARSLVRRLVHLQSYQGRLLAAGLVAVVASWRGASAAVAGRRRSTTNRNQKTTTRPTANTRPWCVTWMLLVLLGSTRRSQQCLLRGSVSLVAGSVVDHG